jgi:hypothetical protein
MNFAGVRKQKGGTSQSHNNCTCSNAQANEKYLFEIHWPLKQLKRHFCGAK